MAQEFERRKMTEAERAKAAAMFAASTQLQSQFAAASTFVGWMAAVSTGRVRRVDRESAALLATIRGAAAPAPDVLAIVGAGTDNPTIKLKADDATLRAVWADSPDIRTEFGTFDRFAAFARADANGLVRISRGIVKG